MTVFKFKFPEAAHAKYGADWYELDFDLIADGYDGGIIERFEIDTGFQSLGELPEMIGKGSFRALRAAMWFAFLVAGKRIKWVAFKADNHTDPRHVEWDVVDAEDPEGEQGPPPPPGKAEEIDGSSGT